MTNFDFLKKDKKFSSFADVAITAERLYNVDLPSCVFNVRRATEFAVKWMYSVDSSLVMPYQDSFVTLINTIEFKDIVGNDIFRDIYGGNAVGMKTVFFRSNQGDWENKQGKPDYVIYNFNELPAAINFLSDCTAVS